MSHFPESDCRGQMFALFLSLFCARLLGLFWGRAYESWDRDGGVIGSCIRMSLPCFYLCFLVSYVVRWSQTGSEEYGHVMSHRDGMTDG